MLQAEHRKQENPVCSSSNRDSEKCQHISTALAHKSQLSPCQKPSAAPQLRGPAASPAQGRPSQGKAELPGELRSNPGARSEPGWLKEGWPLLKGCPRAQLRVGGCARGSGGRSEGFYGWRGWFFSNHRALPKEHLAAKGHHSQGRIFQQLLLKFSKGMTGKTPQHFAPGTIPALYSMALSIC